MITIGDNTGDSLLLEPGKFIELTYLFPWSPGFVGVADFSWWLSGCLLALDTFGLHALCAFLLPCSFPQLLHTAQAASSKSPCRGMQGPPQESRRTPYLDTPLSQKKPRGDAGPAHSPGAPVSATGPPGSAQAHASTTSNDGQGENPGESPGEKAILCSQPMLHNQAMGVSSSPSDRQGSTDRVLLGLGRTARADTQSPRAREALEWTSQPGQENIAAESRPLGEICEGHPMSLPKNAVGGKPDFIDTQLQERRHVGGRGGERGVAGAKVNGNHVGRRKNCRESAVGDVSGPQGIGADELLMRPTFSFGSSHREGRALLASLMGLARTLVGGAAMLSACIQRHHPHAATLFATKFAFEAGMVVAFDVGLLLNDVLVS